MTIYEEIGNGFSIRISQYLYARAAIVKALYAYREKYLIYYSLEEDTLVVYFEPLTQGPLDIKAEVARVFKDLDFQMLRYDTMKQTKEIRELLIARALYTTCIEPDHDELDVDMGSEENSWKDDTQNLFSSWSSEKAE